MQSAMHAIKETTGKIGRSATFKLFTICVLILVLLIPTAMVESLIDERDARKQQVIAEISDKWGGAQVITGPVITIPYANHAQGPDGKTTTWTAYLHILPDSLDIQSQITPHVRYRGMYEAVLYTASLTLSGRFPRAQVADLRVPAEDIQWSDAFISLGITDMRGIADRVEATFNDEPLSMEPGLETKDVIQSGVSAAIAMDDADTSHPFQFQLRLNGSQDIRFAPVGKVTTVAASSEWKDPSFDGAFLPVERSVSDQGFSANWRVLDLNRNYPQRWKGSAHDICQSTFGVTLFSPVDIYQKTTRTAKYALLFIVFTFVAFFLSEVMNRLRVHPVQYLLIGFAVILFYVLLLSISEHSSFGLAYLLSAGAVIGAVTGYAKAILRTRVVTGTVGGILAALYAYLYVVLQLEDYALLMGSIGLFAVLSAIMYLTRRIDWYGVQTGAVKMTPPGGAPDAQLS